jgi:hypothetical protein
MTKEELMNDIFIKETKNIELFQWSIVSSISSLLYSEYIKNMIKKDPPIDKVFVPKITMVKDILNPEGDFIKYLSTNLIDLIFNHDLIKKYIDLTEFNIFKEDKLEVMKDILDNLVVNNIIKRIPETIMIKFQLNNPKQQTFMESNELNLFNRKPINNEQYYYLIEECVLQYILFLPNIVKDAYSINDTSLKLSINSVLSITHRNAVCLIIINHSVIQNKTVFPLISFVTSTNATLLDNNSYLIETNKNNQLLLAILKWRK